MENRKPIEFVTQGRPRFSEIDPYGHMNTTHYASHFLEHRFSGMREKLGWDLKTITALPVFFVVRKMELEFLRPILAEDEFEIRSHVASFGERTCEVVMTLTKKGELSSKGRLEFVCVDRNGRSTVWPTDIVERFFE